MGPKREVSELPAEVIALILTRGFGREDNDMVWEQCHIEGYDQKLCEGWYFDPHVELIYELGTTRCYG